MYFDSDSSENNLAAQESHKDYFQYPNEGKQLSFFDYNADEENNCSDVFTEDPGPSSSVLGNKDIYNNSNLYNRGHQTEVQSDAMSIEEISQEESVTVNKQFFNQPIRDAVKNHQQSSSNLDLTTDVPNGLRSVFEISERYRHIFAGYPCFNAIQSKVMDDMLYSDKPVVVAAPTGSGKTVLFEMAIVRLLQAIDDRNYTGDFKIVYLAPVKALCSERCMDWQAKLGPLGLNCREVTGDSDTNDYFELRDVRVIFTTPEKWDSLTRKWRDNKSLVHVVKLFLIDEVHLLNEERRGPTMEAVVSRMKTVQHSLESELRTRQHRQQNEQHPSVQGTLPHGVRFVAVSATIPNIEDVAEWLSDSSEMQAAFYKISEDQRPVPLKKIVIGYPNQDLWSPFRFDISLTYKLRNVLFLHAEGKPSLIFCSTRKGVQQTAAVLVKDITFHLSTEQREQLQLSAKHFKDAKIRENVLRGVGCHHAGMDSDDRHTVEQLFRNAALPVLVATSTLAMGVNLPAHLVIIKSTEQYVGGAYREYPESQLLQMMGRAGRPQYDTSATAVIMTKNSLKARYERLVDGRQIVESSLHRHLPEHLNAEVVLHTITDLGVAMDWVRSTFLYVRALQDPKAYGVAGHQPGPEQCTKEKIETRLHELCLRELNALASCELMELDGMDVRPTEIGRLMARYYMALDSMKIFMQLTGDETMPEILAAVSRCAEFSEVQLRVNERRPLNMLNRCKERDTVRFPLTGRVKGRDMKVNVLIQAALGGLSVLDPALHQETLKVIRIGQRVSKCLTEFMALKRAQQYQATLHATLLAKGFYCRLWHDSPLVSRQLERIGPALAAQLAAAGKNSFDNLRDANPRDLERILNRAPPLGNMLQSVVSHLPRYALRLRAKEVRTRVVSISLELELENATALEAGSTAGERHAVVLLLAERNSNYLLHRERLADSFLLTTGTYKYETEFQQKLTLEEGDNKPIEIIAHVISEQWAGLDVESLVRIAPRSTATQQQQQQQSFNTPRLSAAPRNLKAALQKFVRKQAVKAVLAPAAREPCTPSISEKPCKVIAGIAASSTPVTRVEKPGRSVSEQIRAKYGQLPSLPVTRLGHNAATPVTAAKLPPSMPETAAEVCNNTEAKLLRSLLLEPVLSPHVSEPISHRSSQRSPPVHATQSQSLVSQSESSSLSPSYSPFPSQEPFPCREILEDMIAPLSGLTDGSQETSPIFEASRKVILPAHGPSVLRQKSPPSKLEVSQVMNALLPPDLPVNGILHVLNFDLGIEELLADPLIPPAPREIKRLVLSPLHRAVVDAKKRRLSPPRDVTLLQQLVFSVLGESAPSATSSPRRHIVFESRGSGSPHRLPEPLLSQEFCKPECATAPLERLSPRSYLDATLANLEPTLGWSADLDLCPGTRRDWSTPEAKRPTAAASSWSTPSPPQFLPPAPQRHTKSWEPPSKPLSHNFMFKY